MDHSEYPVTVAVRRPDGAVEQVRVGTAVRSGDGFQLSLGELRIAGTPERAPARRSAPAGGPVFPNYGRSKGMPIHGASIQDLDYYAGGCRRTLQDPNKSRWHDKERELLAAIEAELARQNAGGDDGGGDPGDVGDVGDVGLRGGGDPAPRFDDDPPPPSDDDLPF